MAPIPRKIELTARIYFSALAVLCVASIVLLVVKGISTGDFKLGTMLLLASFSLVMVQEAWARRFEPLAIAASSPQYERDERRRMLAAKAKATAGSSALIAGIVLFFMTEFFPPVAAPFEALGAVQSMQTAVGLMAFCYFIGRLMFAWILNRKE